MCSRLLSLILLLHVSQGPNLYLGSGSPSVCAVRTSITGVAGGSLEDCPSPPPPPPPLPPPRQLATVNVSPSDNLQTKLTNAGAGDTLNLADGTYTGSGNNVNVLEISKDITIRAQNSGQAILDGENARRVIVITSGTVTLEGLNITRGYTSVRCPCPAALRACLDAH